MRYLLLLAGMVTVMLQAQTSSQNYIVTTVPYRAISDPTSLSDDNSNTAIQYFDGLGRPVQTVQRAITPTGADLVSGIMYDSFGRDSLQWLSGAVTGNDGAYVANFGAASVQTNGDSQPYARTDYEASPLNRVTGQYGPGADWYSNSKKKSIAYTTNAANSVKLFGVNGTGLTGNGYYEPNTLYGQKTTDEDGKWMEEFTDKLGRKVLSRTYDSTYGNHDTYYVYDDLDNLRYVLPPLAADALGSGNYDNNADALLKYAYLYTYDGRKRCISKRLPGCDWIYMVYDLADRLTASQDGNQRTKGQWTVNRYDKFSRLVYSFIATNSQSEITSSFGGTPASETLNGNATTGGYSLTGSANLTAMLTVNYYDNYSFISNATLNYDNSQEQNGYTPYYSNAKNLLTGTRVYHLDDPSTYETTTIYYDKYGRVVQTRANNHLSGYDITYNALDFTGKPLKTLKTHGINGNAATYTELYTYTYDHAQRLLTTTHSLNGATPVTLASNSYDPLGRLQTKTLGGVDATSYAYNVRSWVTGISGNRFTENLYYNQNTTNLANFTASYNGNIAGMLWSVPAEGLGYNRAYTFSYDGLNRLTSGNYTGGTAGAYNETFAYDKMGNITTLNRNENESGLNQLTLNYTGNQLLTAYDALSVTKLYGSEAFDNKANLSTEYLYDTNGSMTYDANSGISTIQYNVLNLPNIVQFTAGHKNIYTYGADGKKLEINNYTLRSAINVPQGSISTLPSNPGDYTKVTTDYIGNMIYENGTLKEILLPEGYWQGSIYYYYLKDHLGDNRVTINSSGAVIEKSHYYPSGMRFFPESSSNSAALPYRYNGKELETMNGLNQYDYGARRRGAGLPMWTAVDPLCEKYPAWSPYVYCKNNPILRIDPNGLTDFTFDKKTGEVKQVGEKNDDPDRILKTNRKGEIKYNRKGEAKVAVGGIEQGILNDGQNFKNKDQVISVGGKGQPSVEGVKSFTLQLSEYVGKEMKGFSYSSNASGNVTDMVLGKYLNNTLTESRGSVTELIKKYGNTFSSNNVLQEFHTHPNGELGATQSAPDQSNDVKGLQSDKPQIPNASFIILYRITGQEQPAEYDYTHEYIP